MKFLFLFNFLLIGYLASSQDFFSRIIPTNENPLIENLEKSENQYLITSDFFNSDGVRGGIIVVLEESDEKFKFENMDLGLSPMLLDDSFIYLVGENPLNSGDSTLFLSKIDKSTLMIEWFKEYSCPVERTVNSSIKKLNDALFILNVNNAGTDMSFQREVMLVKTDLEGQELAKYKYNLDKRTTYAYELFNTKDSNLILSNIFSKKNEATGVYSQLIKVNLEGEIVWKYEGIERLDNGAVPTWAIELSDTSILQTYYVDRRSEVDFIVNNWFPEPNKFIWLNAEGELEKEKLIITDKQVFILYNGLKTGKGDYFYAYGYYEDRRPPIYDQFFGHLTKFTNEGDTIWSRNYQHPSYPDGNIVHNIKDILEEENGDITILADITPPGAKTEIWLFKVNSEGCFINEECEDMTFTTSVEEIGSSKQLIYPNPTSEELHISWKTVIQAITILDITGKVVKYQKANGKSATVDMTLLNKGIYIVQIQDDSNTITANKIIKL